MALDRKVGSFNTGTGTSDIVVSGLGFSPEAIIFWWNGRTETTDAEGGLTHHRGFGFAVSATDRRAMVNRSSNDRAAGALTYRYMSNVAVIAHVDSNGTLDGAVDVASMDSDGFTLAIDDAFPADMRVHYLALGGADLTNAKGGAFLTPTSTGDFDVTDVGFQPDAVLLMSIYINSTTVGDSGDSEISFGAGVSGGAEAVWAAVSENANQPTDTYGYCRAGEILADIDVTNGDIDLIASYVQSLSNGFRLNFSKAPGAAQSGVFYLALKGGRYAIGDLLTRTDTNNIAETGLGVGTPRAILFLSQCKAQSTTDVADAGDEWSMGAATSTTERAAMSVLDQDAVNTTNVGGGVSHDEVYQNLSTADPPAMEGEMDMVSFDTDGFTAVMDDTDPSAAFVWYLAIGNASGGTIGRFASESVDASDAVIVAKSPTTLRFLSEAIDAADFIVRARIPTALGSVLGSGRLGRMRLGHGDVAPSVPIRRQSETIDASDTVVVAKVVAQALIRYVSETIDAGDLTRREFAFNARPSKSAAVVHIIIGE